MTHMDGQVEGLSFAEGQILRIFLSRLNRLMTRDYILDQLSSGQSEQFDRAIDVRIPRLRADSNGPKIIKTIYGVGYIFIASCDGEAG